ncbi:MAG TPA: DUF488 domain-containing protein [Stenotrophomonas sp.]
MIHTIGHSNRRWEVFLDLLLPAGVRWLADVRAIPRSRFNPQFNGKALIGALAAAGIGYRHLPALGGRREGHYGLPPSLNAHWGKGAFHAYADYALGPEFAAGLAELRELGQEGGCVMMCAEADWRQCHRQIVADHLLHAGEPVMHIVADGIIPASLNPAARVDAAGRLHYPAGGISGDLFG